MNNWKELKIPKDSVLQVKRKHKMVITTARLMSCDEITQTGGQTPAAKHADIGMIKHLGHHLVCWSSQTKYQGNSSYCFQSNWLVVLTSLCQWRSRLRLWGKSFKKWVLWKVSPGIEMRRETTVNLLSGKYRVTILPCLPLIWSLITNKINVSMLRTKTSSLTFQSKLKLK